MEQAREKFSPLQGAAALREFMQLENKTTELFNIMFQLILWSAILCAKRKRALRSGNQGYSDCGWPKVFCVFELEDSVCLCVRHYEKLRESNKTSCCFPQSSVRDTCSGRLTKYPQRLVKGTNKLFMNPHICKKHLSQADTEERILNSKHNIYSSEKGKEWANIWFQNILHIAVGSELCT